MCGSVFQSYDLKRVSDLNKRSKTLRFSCNFIFLCAGYYENWSREVFEIIKVKPTIPTTYLLCDLTPKRELIQGAFYEAELTLADKEDSWKEDGSNANQNAGG